MAYTMEDLEDQIRAGQKVKALMIVKEMKVDDLFRDGAFINFVNHTDWSSAATMVRMAAALAIVEKASELARKDLINIADDHGYTALHWAEVIAQTCETDDFDVEALKRSLEKAGANKNAKADQEGFTPAQFGKMVNDANVPNKKAKL